MKIKLKNRTEWRNKQGQLHREDGPAIICFNGGQGYFQNGKKHREDGPAVIYPDGIKEWWLNDKEILFSYSMLKYFVSKIYSKLKLEFGIIVEFKNKKGQLHRTDGPALIEPDGSQLYFQNGKLHREYEPAMILSSGKQIYFQNGAIHREDGPAVIYPNGSEEYYLNGKHFTKDKYENQIKK